MFACFFTSYLSNIIRKKIYASNITYPKDFVVVCGNKSCGTRLSYLLHKRHHCLLLILLSLGSHLNAVKKLFKSVLEYVEVIFELPGINYRKYLAGPALQNTYIRCLVENFGRGLLPP